MKIHILCLYENSIVCRLIDTCTIQGVFLKNVTAPPSPFSIYLSRLRDSSAQPPIKDATCVRWDLLDECSWSDSLKRTVRSFNSSEAPKPIGIK